MQRIPVFIFLILAMATLAACSGGDFLDEADDMPDGDTDVATDGDDEATGVDGDSDAEKDGDEDADSDGDVINPLDLPNEPGPIANPLPDLAYAQEINHTTPEVELDIGEVLALIMPGEKYEDFDKPTQITPRGIVYHVEGQEGFSLAAIPEGDDPLIAAAATGDLDGVVSPNVVAVASRTTVYRVLEDFTLQAYLAPEGIEINGLYAGSDNSIYILTTSGYGMLIRYDEDGPVWRTSASEYSAAVEVKDLIIWANGSHINAHAPPSYNEDRDTLMWGTSDGMLGVGRIVAMVADVTLPQPLDLVVIGENGLAGMMITDDGGEVVDVPAFAADRVPLVEPRAAEKTSDGGFVVATSGGSYRIMDRGHGPEWRVYNAERWMPSEDVRDVLTTPKEADSPVYFATALGMSWATTARMTIEEKMVGFNERLKLRHDRDGAVADSHLTERGDLSTNIPWDSDNDGGWTCYQVLAQCYRWLETGNPDAKTQFDKALQAMLNLQLFTGTDYFLARSVIRKEGCQLDDCDDPDDGEWFTSPDGEWWVKADTSNDEVTSHMFMMGPAYDLCADDEQKAAITQHVDRIIGGIIDNGYKLVDLDGEVTTHGNFDPEYVNESLSGMYGDGGRRSVQMIGALNLAYHLTGKQKYMDAKQELMDDHHYDDNIVIESTYSFRKGSGDGDELATQGFWPLIRYESDPALLAMWREGWNTSYANMRLQQASLWDVSNAILGGDDPDMGMARRWLQLAPVDMIRWTQHNSHRQDLVLPPEYYKDDGRQRSDGFIIPYDERRCDRFNTDQYRVDGGHGGWVEMDGAEAFSTYWMARYYGFIVPEEEAGAK